MSASTDEATTSLVDQVIVLQNDQEKQQEEMKVVVLDAVKRLCTEDSCFEQLHNIGAALQHGDQLIATIIAGGKANFSYKLHLKQSPSTALYAKIAFDYALWNVDRKNVNYDLKRMDNEFWIMNKFSDVAATPYAIVDLSDNSKLMVTQWAMTDKQFCNQFIDGQVDKRVISKVAKALARINLTSDFDLDFNGQVKNNVDNMFTMMKEVGRQLRGDETLHNDKCLLTLKQWSLDKLDMIVDGSIDSWHMKEVLCHADAHVFNILVEKKPVDIHHLEAFGPNGDFVLCDWETSSACCKGRDTGIFLYFPIICALCHAVQGHKAQAYEILDCLDLFWDTYAEIMVAGGKDDTYLQQTFRNSLGNCGLFLFLSFYILKFFQEMAPLQGVPEADAKQAFGSSGYIGLKFMEYGFAEIEPDLTLDELRNQYKEIIHTEVESMSAVSAGRLP